MSDPIQKEYHGQMNDLAAHIDEWFNGKSLPGLPRDRKVGFVLLVAEFGKMEGGRVNYISNGERGDMVTMLREYLARLEGRVIENETSQ